MMDIMLLMLGTALRTFFATILALKIDFLPKAYRRLRSYKRNCATWAGNVMSSIAAPIARMWKYGRRAPVWGDLSCEEQARLSWDDFPNQHKVGLQDLTRTEDRNLLWKLLKQHVMLVHQFGGQPEMRKTGVDKLHNVCRLTIDTPYQFDAITLSIVTDNIESFDRGDEVAVVYSSFRIPCPTYGHSESCRDRYDWFPLDFMSFTGKVGRVIPDNNALIILVTQIYTKAGIEIHKREPPEWAINQIVYSAPLP